MLNLNEQTLTAYKQKARAQIKEMKAKMKMFEASAEKVGADMRINYQKTLDEWKSRFREVEMKLDSLPDSMEENWDDLQADVDERIMELRNKIENMTKQFNN